jgi:hypothetical protein
LIREVSIGHQGSAPRDVVLDRAGKMGVEREKVDAIIDLRRREHGDLYSQAWDAEAGSRWASS